MNKQQINYKKLGKILWSVMPDNEKIIILDGAIYDTFTQFGCHKELSNSETELLDDIPESKLDEMLNILQTLQAETNWTHCLIRLDITGKMTGHFIYIPEEDSWLNLVMKGISDLTEEEWEETAIPKELWEERVRLHQTVLPPNSESAFTVEIQLDIQDWQKEHTETIQIKPITIDTTQGHYDVLSQVLKLLFPENAKMFYCDFRVNQGVTMIGLSYKNSTDTMTDIETNAILNGYSASEAIKILDKYLCEIHQYDQSQNDDWDRALIQVSDKGQIFFQTEFDSYE